MEHTIMQEGEARKYVHETLSEAADVWEKVRLGIEIENSVAVTIPNRGAKSKESKARLRMIIANELGVSGQRYSSMKQTREGALSYGLNLATIRPTERICTKHRCSYQQYCKQCDKEHHMTKRKEKRAQKPNEEQGEAVVDYAEIVLDEIRTNTDGMCKKLESLFDVWESTIKTMDAKHVFEIRKNLDKVSKYIDIIKGGL